MRTSALPDADINPGQEDHRIGRVHFELRREVLGRDTALSRLSQKVGNGAGLFILAQAVLLADAIELLLVVAEVPLIILREMCHLGQSITTTKKLHC